MHFLTFLWNFSYLVLPLLIFSHTHTYHSVSRIHFCIYIFPTLCARNFGSFSHHLSIPHHHGSRYPRISFANTSHLPKTTIPYNSLTSLFDHPPVPPYTRVLFHWCLQKSLSLRRILLYSYSENSCYYSRSQTPGFISTSAPLINTLRSLSAILVSSWTPSNQVPWSNASSSLTPSTHPDFLYLSFKSLVTSVFQVTSRLMRMQKLLILSPVRPTLFFFITVVLRKWQPLDIHLNYLLLALPSLQFSRSHPAISSFTKETTMCRLLIIFSPLIHSYLLLNLFLSDCPFCLAERVNVSHLLLNC